MSTKPVFERSAMPAAIDIKTRAELDKLRAHRPKPAPQKQLTPKGQLLSQVNALERYRNQSRIAQLQHSLNERRNAIERGFSLGSQKGRAKADFGRDR